MLEVFAWSSFSCNNSSDYRLVARFASAKKAAAMQEELAAFFKAHGAQQDAAGGRGPTAAARALGDKHGHRWKQTIVWGDGDGPMADAPPYVVALADSLVIYHSYCGGGFGDDVRAVLKKAGASFPEGKDKVGPPVLLVDFELPAGKPGDALGRELAAMFAQRHSVEYIEEWDDKTDDLAWGQGEGKSTDVGFVLDGRRVSLSWPIHADYVRLLEKYLTRRKVARLSIRLAAPDDIKALRQRDAAARKLAAAEARKGAAKKAPGTRPAATATADVPPRTPRGTPSGPQGRPSVDIVHQGRADYLYDLASAGAALVAVGAYDENRLLRSTDGAKFAPVALPGPGLRAIACRQREVWICGEAGQLFRSTDGGARFRSVSIAGAGDLDGVAIDDRGTVFVSGSFSGKGCLRSSSDGGAAWTAHGLTGIHAMQPTALGLCIATIDGKLGLLRAGKWSPFSKVAPGEMLHDIAVTARGAILAVGNEGRCLRSEGGGPFVAVKMPGAEDLHAVAVMADGRVIAAGGMGGQILISHDDGRSFALLKRVAKARIFWSAARFGDAVYLCGMHELIVRVS
jgi:photosystem II stability/assembly factor-like uncharacterized protein